MNSRHGLKILAFEFKTSVLAMNWYQFNGGDPTNPTNYTIIFVNPEDFCPTGGTVCAILAQPNPINATRPIITPGLKADIAIATGLRTHHPPAPNTNVWTKLP